MYEDLDEQGVFGKSLDAASGANRFRQPSLPPGERTSALEERMLALANELTERVAAALERARLTREESATLVGRTLAFLSDRDMSTNLGTETPDLLAFFDEVDMLLARFGVFEREREDALHEIASALNAAALQYAA